MASSSLPSVGADSSDTASSSGSSKGDRSMRCVCEVAEGAGARKLLCREFEVKLGGAMLCGRYGGGGSVRLLLSAKGSTGRRVFEVTEIMSDVSMPVR